MPETALVIGSESTVGKILIERLMALPEMTVLTSSRTGGDIPIDLEKQNWATVRLGTFDTLILVAADFGGSQPSDYARAERINSIGIANLMQAAVGSGVSHVVLCSTIFAGYSSVSPYFSAYGLTKRHGEEMAQAICSSLGIKLTILRISQIYDSKGLCQKHQPFLYRITKDVRAGRKTVIFGSRDPTRNYIHLDDVATAVGYVAVNRVTGSWECVNPQNSTIADIAKIAYLHLGLEPRIEFDRSHADLTDIQVGIWPNIFDAHPLNRPKDIRLGVAEILESVLP